MSGSTRIAAEQVLGPGGVLASVLPGYESRPEQLRMAREVEAAIEGKSYLLAEAGTGTGKTLAYLVPAVLSGRKVVISTATKTLQEQIFQRDIPLLRDRVGLKFGAAYLKGRANYLCLHRFESFQRSPTFVSRDEGKLWPSFVEWAHGTETGDRAEADVPETFSPWPELSTTSETCLGRKCPAYDTCFVTRARRRAEGADIIVVNHHLFFADLALRGRAPADGILPEHEVAVFDEAHALEGAATEHFGIHVSSLRLEELAKDAQRALPATHEQAGMLNALALKSKGSAERYFKSAAQAMGLSDGGSARLHRGLLDNVRDGVDATTADLEALASFCDAADDAGVQQIGKRARDLSIELQFIQRCESQDHVYWGEARRRGLFLRAAPIDVSGELSKRLYPRLDTLIFTSATLAAEGKFDFFTRRMGLDPAVTGRNLRAVTVPSPFDFRTQAALYLPSHLPEPNDPLFTRAVADEIVALVEMTGGRAFALFTSLRNMLEVHGLCHHRLPFQVLLQGERPKTVLLDAFRSTPSVLFASHSFWEGVDVPGDALSLVIIDKLPFASPGDPLVAARVDRLRQRGEEPFSSYQVPEAALALRQGFGRLIRSRQDRGVVALLDRRITAKAYGRSFLKSLPNAWRTSDPQVLAKWFGRT